MKEEIYYESRDGKTQIHSVKWTPEKEPKAVIQIVHGMAEYIERYEDFALFLNSQGFVVVGNDHLGHGKSVSEDVPKGYFCEQDPATVVVRDVHRLKKLTQEKYPKLPYIILGHSMGSFILRNYLTTYGTGIQAAVVVGTGMMPNGVLNFGILLSKLISKRKGTKYPSPFVNAVSFGGYNKKIKKPATPMDWLSRNEDNVKKYMEDENCGFTFTTNGFITLFTLLKRLNSKANLEKVPKDLPIFFIAGHADPVGNYGAGVAKAVKSLMDCGVENIHMKYYEEDRHEILNEVDKEVVYQDVVCWLDSLKLY